MDFITKLECMTYIAIEQSEQSNEPSHDDIQQWQRLFGLSYSQALTAIQEHRSDLSRPRVPDSHWEIVPVEKKAEGFDKDAYKQLGTTKTRKTSTTLAAASHNNGNDKKTYLLKPEGPLNILDAAVR